MIRVNAMQEQHTCSVPRPKLNLRLLILGRHGFIPIRHRLLFRPWRHKRRTPAKDHPLRAQSAWLGGPVPIWAKQSPLCAFAKLHTWIGTALVSSQPCNSQIHTCTLFSTFKVIPFHMRIHPAAEQATCAPPLLPRLFARLSSEAFSL